MASSPRTGRSNPAVAAVIVGVVLLAGIVGVLILSGGDPLALSQRVVTSLYPPEAVTSQGAEIRTLYTIVFLIAAVIFVVVEGLIIWTVIRYKRRPGDDALPAQTHGNAIAEAVWTIVPTIIVAFLFVVSWQTLNTVEAVSAEPDTRIRAVGSQFQWTFDYLDDAGEVVYTEFIAIRTEGQGGMVVPAGRSVLLTLESPDVIHAFYVPQFLFKRDVVPGRVNQFEFTVDADQAGQTFRGQCAELCGAGHRAMLFDVHALEPAAFDAWLQERIEAANATPPPQPSGGAGGAAIPVSAVALQFEQTELQAPADSPFQIAFENKDADIPHNIEIKDAGGAQVFLGDIFPGVATQTYDVPPLAAGAYTFLCTVHPTMTGTLTAN